MASPSVSEVLRNLEASIPTIEVSASLPVADAADGLAGLDERRDEWLTTFVPANDAERWLYEQIIVTSLQIDLCKEREKSLVTYLKRRAKLAWDLDQASDARNLGARLKRDPSRVLAKLEMTRHGCLWLIDRWEALGRALASETDGGWNDDRRTVALNLRGVPHDERSVFSNVGFNDPAALVREEVEWLRERLASMLNELDKMERDSAEAGLYLELPPALARLRREESTWMRRHLWARANLQILQRDRQGDEPAATSPPPQPKPASSHAAPVVRSSSLRDPIDDLFHSQSLLNRPPLTLEEDRALEAAHWALVVKKAQLSVAEDALAKPR